MKINSLEWDNKNIAHVASHGITIDEVEEACYFHPLIMKGRGGLYLVYGRTESGRYILVVIRYKDNNIARPITARDMTDNERRLFQRRH